MICSICSTIIHKTPLRISNHIINVYACAIKMHGHGKCLVKTVCDKETLTFGVRQSASATNWREHPLSPPTPFFAYVRPDATRGESLSERPSSSF